MIRKTFRFLGQIEEYLLCLMILQMGLSVFLQVIMRFVFHSAITWLDELVHIEVVLLTFFGASLGIKHGAHICVDLLKNSVKEPFLSLLEALNHAVIAVYSGLVIYFGTNLIILMTSHPHFTPTLRIPKHYLYFLVCIGLGLICIRSLLKSYQFLSSLLFGRSGGESS
jgi:TRAP-type C4-dicarboxylate transport system permease small subunit